MFGLLTNYLDFLVNFDVVHVLSRLVKRELPNFNDLFEGNQPLKCVTMAIRGVTIIILNVQFCDLCLENFKLHRANIRISKGQ